MNFVSFKYQFVLHAEKEFILNLDEDFIKLRRGVSRVYLKELLFDNFSPNIFPIFPHFFPTFPRFPT